MIFGAALAFALAPPEPPWFADRGGATAQDPLIVNFVAHSHGGNVVLEALRRLNENVKVNKVVMLGTPLIKVKPAFRIARIVFSTFLFAFLLYILGLTMFSLGYPVYSLIVYQKLSFYDYLGLGNGGLELLMFIALGILYGWGFWLLGNYLDVVWRVINRIWQPF